MKFTKVSPLPSPGARHLIWNWAKKKCAPFAQLHKFKHKICLVLTQPTSNKHWKIPVREWWVHFNHQKPHTTRVYRKFLRNRSHDLTVLQIYLKETENIKEFWYNSLLLIEKLPDGADFDSNDSEERNRLAADLRLLFNAMAEDAARDATAKICPFPSNCVSTIRYPFNNVVIFFSTTLLLLISIYQPENYWSKLNSK